jgi:hypothetical protein
MKFLARVLAIFFCQFGFASADFSVVQNGVTYFCSAQSNPSPDGALRCINKAYAGPFSKDESIQLCQGANSTGPADCGLKLYAGPFSKSETLRVCSGALSLGPADCALKLYAGPFSKEESIAVCGRLSNIANADCALKAYAGPYSKEESIRLCKSSLHKEMSSMKSPSTADLEEKERLNQRLTTVKGLEKKIIEFNKFENLK